MLGPGLRVVLNAQGIDFGVLSASMCPPILGYDSPDRPYCREFNLMAWQMIREAKPDLVLLTSSWSFHPDDMVLIREQVRGTLAAIEASRIDVVIVGDPITFFRPVPLQLAERAKAGIATTVSDPALHMIDQATQIRDNMTGYILKDGGYRFVSIRDAVCPDFRCPMAAADGDPLFFDRSHLSEKGSVYVAKALLPHLPLP
jgi:hypothetical protein